MQPSARLVSRFEDFFQPGCNWGKMTMPTVQLLADGICNREERKYDPPHLPKDWALKYKFSKHI
jgi:hypothetical protein